MRYIKIGNYIPKEVKVDEFLEEVKSKLKIYYEGSEKWFAENYEDILVPGNRNSKKDRQFIIIYDAANNSKLIGFVLLKYTKEDKKVATLYIMEDYRNQGIASSLLKEAVRYFGEKENPYIFFSENVLIDNPLFPYVLIKNDFVYTRKENGQYFFRYYGGKE